MFDFHLDRFEYFKTQIVNTEKSIIPFIEHLIGSLKPGQNVLEIGSAEGGVLKAFVDKGCLGTGIELDPVRIEQSRKYLSDDIANGKISIHHRDIFDNAFVVEFSGKFDLIVLKDVIEHIHDQEGLIRRLKQFLSPVGTIFFGFPPWKMPFGGHQQICKNRVLSRLPWFHLLPAFIYKAILKGFGEDCDYLIDIKQTGLSIRHFEAIVKRQGCNIVGRKLYLISPIYEFKFGIRPREQFTIISRASFFRDFFTTGVYYLIKIE